MFDLESNGGLRNEQVTSIRLPIFQGLSNGFFFGFMLNSIHHRNPGTRLRDGPFTEQLARFFVAKRSAPRVFRLFRGYFGEGLRFGFPQKKRIRVLKLSMLRKPRAFELRF